MTLADFPSLTRLPKRQRLKLAEELWFSGVDDDLAVRAEQKSELDGRWKAYKRGRIRRLSMQELTRRLGRA